MKQSIRRLIVVSLTSAVLTGSTASAGTDQRTREAVERVNHIRTEHGLPVLRVESESLQSAADVRAEEASRRFSHTRPDGRPWYTVNDRIVYGENLAVNYFTAEQVVNAWMASPSHKENILNRDFTHLSISLWEKDGSLYWSQEFGIE